MHNTFDLPQTPTEHIDFRLLSITHGIQEGPFSGSLFSHAFTQLFYLVSGKGFLISEGARTPIKPNDFVIVNPHCKYKLEGDENDPLEYVCMSIDGIAFQLGATAYSKKFVVLSYNSASRNIRNYITFMLHEAEKRRDFYEVICKDLTEMLVLSISRMQQIQIHFTNDPSLSKECNSAKSFIDSHYREEFSLEDLAAAAHVSKYYLEHSFSKYMGETCSSYIHKKRTQSAAELLLETNDSISQIASSVGFNSSSYFAKIFKRYQGMSPAAYRKEKGQPHLESQ